MKDNHILIQLKNIFAAVLLCSEEELMLDRPYIDMGVDSILAIQIAKLIKIKLGYEIFSSDLYNFTSINDLAIHMERLKASEQTHSSKGNNFKPNKKENKEKIAIIGISGRFPGAASPNEYWENLIHSKCSITNGNRWDGFTDKKYKGGFLENITHFDSNFFNISPREAALMDPQQRILMEVAWEAFEDAGLTKEALNDSKCGVFTTSLPGDYKNNTQDNKKIYNNFSFLGNAVSVNAGRISYFFNLKAPSINIDTACSSSLVAIDLAIKYLESGICDTALIGASCIFSTPELFKLAKNSNLLSKSGLCYSFDERADGFVPAETVSCIVLKKISDAIRDRHRIYGIMEAIGVNHDGYTNGLMSPNVDAQKELITSIYRGHEINLSELGYVEAHGTGTAIGDPLEIKALKESFEQLSDYKCYIGSSKANIGHALVASALASIIKIVLSFKHNTIPPQINFANLNPEIKLGAFKINTNVVKWPKEKNLAAISAFGFSGTNAHLVLRKPEQINLNKIDTIRPYIFLFSAKNKRQLEKLLHSYKIFLSGIEDQELACLSYSLNCSLTHFPNKFVSIAETKEQLLENINIFLNDKHNCSINTYQKPPYSKEEVMYRLTSNELTGKELYKYLAYIAYFLMHEEKITLQALYPNFVHNISLPSYPFCREYSWIGQDGSFHNTETSIKKNDAIEAYIDDNKWCVVDKLKTRLSDILGYKVEAISSDQPLQSFGIDSIVALQLLDIFQEEYGAVNPQIILTSNNLNELAENLEKLKKKNQSKPQLELNISNTTKIFSKEFAYNTILQDGIEWFIFGENNRNTIVFLPPLNTLAHVWIQQLRFFLKGNNTIYIPHYPGHGNSLFKEPDLENLVLSIFKSFEAIAGKYKKFDLLGWSLGGCIAIILSLVSPRVQNLILINTSAKFDNDIFAQSITLREALLYHQNYLQDLFDFSAQNIIDYISAGCSLEVLKYYYNRLQEFDATPKLSSLNVRCMIVYGENDPVINLHDINRLNFIRDSKIISFENEGHFIPLTAPFKFNRLIKNFMDYKDDIKL
ncbi:alpha/beta fold hydrolase [Candidatus Cardinium hertigii]|uniref:Polyketide synthase PksL n=1 Tax=Candidatus Cardinium hertigii TaxID=247481 RepID=A0A2Z3L764_9BACT|nr:alpha/beta fold hydrolase [Candidatus Cardinium hertigii]AWN81558.1 Polyketide synthase PksL [Candidatus Cardinium hertigii]